MKAEELRQLCRNFDKFEFKHIELEQAYNAAHEAALEAHDEIKDILFYIEKGNSGNTAYTSSSDMVRSKRSIFGRADFKFDRRFGVLYNNVFCGLQKIII